MIHPNLTGRRRARATNNVHGPRTVTVIADRFSKVTKTIPLRTVTALSLARAFYDHPVYAYGPPPPVSLERLHRSTITVTVTIKSGSHTGMNQNFRDTVENVSPTGAAITIKFMVMVTAAINSGSFTARFYIGD
jgi:hypothetical protein